MIYLDNAATSFYKPSVVRDAVAEALVNMGNPGRGAHGPALKAAGCVYDCRAKLARLFNVSDPAQIAFTSGATESLNLAIQGLIRSGDHVITSAREHNSVLRPLYKKAAEGAHLTILPMNDDGSVSVQAYLDAIRPETRAIVTCHASNVTGHTLDLVLLAKGLKEINAKRQHKVYLVIDGAQSAGAMPVDVEAMGIDVFCFSGHKGLMGPQGIGGIYVREGIKLAPLKVGGSGVDSFNKNHPDVMPTALEAGTLNTPGIAGLAAAVDWILGMGTRQIRQVEYRLANRFYWKIKDIPGVTVYGNPNAPLSGGIVSIRIDGDDQSYFCDALWERYEICVRSGAHCAPLVHEHFHTEHEGMIRFSFSLYNSLADVDTAIRAVKELAEEGQMA